MGPATSLVAAALAPAPCAGGPRQGRSGDPVRRWFRRGRGGKILGAASAQDCCDLTAEEPSVPLVKAGTRAGVKAPASTFPSYARITQMPAASNPQISSEQGRMLQRGTCSQAVSSAPCTLPIAEGMASQAWEALPRQDDSDAVAAGELSKVDACHAPQINPTNDDIPFIIKLGNNNGTATRRPHDLVSSQAAAAAWEALPRHRPKARLSHQGGDASAGMPAKDVVVPSLTDDKASDGALVAAGGDGAVGSREVGTCGADSVQGARPKHAGFATADSDHIAERCRDECEDHGNVANGRAADGDNRGHGWHDRDRTDFNRGAGPRGGRGRGHDASRDNDQRGHAHDDRDDWEHGRSRGRGRGRGRGGGGICGPPSNPDNGYFPFAFDGDEVVRVADKRHDSIEDGNRWTARSISRGADGCARANECGQDGGQYQGDGVGADAGIVCPALVSAAPPGGAARSFGGGAAGGNVGSTALSAEELRARRIARFGGSSSVA
eukprot:NODE_2542_length_2192_cov_4.017433.p1 GENE.NODE_2542_length_2192_cov_4.017433~~NODE_2542_length_2192_cov_4.017433.p1  ORF type:complete len:495 (+),score=54.87 NODE_2542_length_2192_cov_4.017433:619-2103(+)